MSGGVETVRTFCLVGTVPTARLAVPTAVDHRFPAPLRRPAGRHG